MKTICAGKSFRTAWEECERADWLLWLAAGLDAPMKERVLAGCACARLALKYIPEGEERPRIAIETAERHAWGEATREELTKAADGAAIYAAISANGPHLEPAVSGAAYAAAFAAYSCSCNAPYTAAAAAANTLSAILAFAANEVERKKMKQDCVRAARGFITFESVLSQAWLRASGSPKEPSL